MMALAAVVAGASGQSLNGTGPASPRQMTRGPPATEENAEPTTVERGVEDETCVEELITKLKTSDPPKVTEFEHVGEAKAFVGGDFVLSNINVITKVNPQG